MVRTSQRKKNLKAAEDLLQKAEDDEENNNFEEAILGERIEPSFGDILFNDDLEMAFMTDILFNGVDDAEDLLDILEKLRYHDARWKMPFEMDFSLKDLLRDREAEFRQCMRTSHAGFYAILEVIQEHDIFISTSRNPQPPVIIQLALTLERLGTNGTGCSVRRLGRDYKRSMGAIVNCTRRCLTAIDDLCSHYIQWPNAERREEISTVMALEGFPGCVGFVDGTNIPLYQRPGLDGETFFDRKKRYSMNCQVVCDCDRRIIGLYSGWPGSCHDQKVFSSMSLSKDPDRFFSDGMFPLFFLKNKKMTHMTLELDEYLLGDSAYKITNTVVSTYKAPASRLERNSIFNTLVAVARIRNEHGIGIWKERFGSLQGLRLRLDQEDDIKFILIWIKGCAILSNMLADLGDQWEEEFEDDYIHDNYEVAEVLEIEVDPTDPIGVLRRELVRDHAISFNQDS